VTTCLVAGFDSLDLSGTPAEDGTVRVEVPVACNTR
jgi:hypothetical protein